MPFPDHGGVIAGLAELDGERLLSRLNTSLEIEASVGVVILPG